MGPAVAEAGDDVEADPAPTGPAAAHPEPPGAELAGPELARTEAAVPESGPAEPERAAPRENTFDPMAMKVPHSPQNMRPGGLVASQPQHVSVGAGDGRFCGATGGKG